MRSTILAQKRAKTLRRALTAPETRLWVRLRERRDGEPAFRRQHPFGVYILDFFCSAARLVVEVDGQVHYTEGQPAHDARRDAWLRSQGLTVRRIAASEVMADPDQIADSVRTMAREMALSLLHRKAGEGDRAQRGGGGETWLDSQQEGRGDRLADSTEAAAPSTASRSPSPVSRGRR